MELIIGVLIIIAGFWLLRDDFRQIADWMRNVAVRKFLGMGLLIFGVGLVALGILSPPDGVIAVPVGAMMIVASLFLLRWIRAQ